MGGLVNIFWEGLGWVKMLTGSPFLCKNHLRRDVAIDVVVNEVCAFAFLGIFSLSFNAEIVFSPLEWRELGFFWFL